ncbi:MAG: hypothetical protein MK066_14055, partial [Crocinitomicaceae bacterium]|nr:hypothetical protein [Crocinitomicaceae bacterium]
NGSNDYPTFGTFFFYEAIKLYFLNGGGPCYILPVGNHPNAATSGNYINQTDFSGALSEIERLDEPTLIAFPEAVNLTENKYGEIAKAALTIAGDLQDK